MSQSENAATTDSQDSVESSTVGPPEGGGPTRRRLDPLSIAAITVISLAIALFVTLVIVRVFDDDEAIDVSTAFDEQGAPTDGGSLEVGDKAPDATLEGLDGGSIALADLRDKPTVINFWSSTCAPCLAEMPALEEVHQDLGDQVAFLGIDVTDTADAGREMVRKTGVTYPNARDPKAEVMGLYGGIALPRTVLVDSDGVVVAVHNGELTAAELTESLQDNDLA